MDVLSPNSWVKNPLIGAVPLSSVMVLGPLSKGSLSGGCPLSSAMGEGPCYIEVQTPPWLSPFLSGE